MMRLPINIGSVSTSPAGNLKYDELNDIEELYKQIKQKYLAMQSQNDGESRRRFLKNSFITGGLFPLMNSNAFSMFNTAAEERLKIHVFSKHLQFLNYHDMA